MLYIYIRYNFIVYTTSRKHAFYIILMHISFRNFFNFNDISISLTYDFSKKSTKIIFILELRYPYCVQYVFIMNTLCRDDPHIYILICILI